MKKAWRLCPPTVAGIALFIFSVAGFPVEERAVEKAKPAPVANVSVDLEIVAPDGEVIPVKAPINSRVTLTHQDTNLQFDFVARKEGKNKIRIDVFDNAEASRPIDSGSVEYNKDATEADVANINGFDFSVKQISLQKTGKGDVDAPNKCCIHCNTYTVCGDNVCACGHCCYTP